MWELGTHTLVSLTGCPGDSTWVGTLTSRTTPSTYARETERYQDAASVGKIVKSDFECVGSGGLGAVREWMTDRLAAASLLLGVCARSMVEVERRELAARMSSPGGRWLSSLCPHITLLL